jgi:putative copper resistance protein D
LIEAGLVTARFLHFAAVTALFGLALFPLYSFPSRGDKPSASVSDCLRNALLWAAVLALLSNLLWGLFTVANMVGTLNAVADPDTLLAVGLETSFGQVWVARLALTVMLLALLVGPRQRHWIIPLLSAMLLASLAFVGHTQSNEGLLRVIHMTVDSAHLLGAGAWLGGLLALGLVLMLVRRFPSEEHNAQAIAVLLRFSSMGYAGVAILTGSGLVNAWVLVGSPGRLTMTPYGQLLLVKVCLFVGMLALATLNRFRLVPALQRSKEGCLSTELSLRLLRRNVIGEQMLGLAIVLIVSWLGTLQPAITASQ